MSEMNIKELAARVVMADPKELADAIQEVAETKRVLDRLGGKRLGGAAPEAGGGTGSDAGAYFTPDAICGSGGWLAKMVEESGIKFEPLKTMSPLGILQSKYGYKFEVRERDHAVLVRRVTGVKNPHYIVSQSILRVKAANGGGVPSPARYRRTRGVPARSRMRLFAGAVDGRSRGDCLAQDHSEEAPQGERR